MIKAKNILIYFSYDDLVRFGSRTDLSVEYLKQVMEHAQAILNESKIKSKSLFKYLPIKKEEINKFSISLDVFKTGTENQVRATIIKFDGACYLPFITKEETIDPVLIQIAREALIPFEPIWKFLVNPDDYKALLLSRDEAREHVNKTIVHMPRKERGARKR